MVCSNCEYNVLDEVQHFINGMTINDGYVYMKNDFFTNDVTICAVYGYDISNCTENNPDNLFVTPKGIAFQ